MDELIQKLSKKAIDLSGESKKELERTCWMIVHEHKHGVMPTEYDIREIDEELYLEVLRTAKDMIQEKGRNTFICFRKATPGKFSIQGDSLRITGKNKDDLQSAINLIKKQEDDLDIALQFQNYRQ